MKTQEGWGSSSKPHRVWVLEHSFAALHPPGEANAEAAVHQLWWSITLCGCGRQDDWFRGKAAPWGSVWGLRWRPDVLQRWGVGRLRARACPPGGSPPSRAEAAGERPPEFAGKEGPVSFITREGLDQRQSWPLRCCLLQKFGDKKEGFLNCSAVVMSGWRGSGEPGYSPAPPCKISSTSRPWVSVTWQAATPLSWERGEWLPHCNSLVLQILSCTSHSMAAIWTGVSQVRPALISTMTLRSRFWYLPLTDKNMGCTWLLMSLWCRVHCCSLHTDQELLWLLGRQQRTRPQEPDHSGTVQAAPGMERDSRLEFVWETTKCRQPPGTSWQE